MHERQAALNGAILALMFLAPAHADKDAAIKAQEGNVDQWIEYYRKDREPATALPARPQGGAAAENGGEKRKEEIDKVKVKR